MSTPQEPAGVPHPRRTTPTAERPSTIELAAALAALPDPVFLLHAVRDPDGAIVELLYAFANHAAARLYGMPVEAIVGRGQCELFPSVRELGIFDACLAVIDSGTPASFDVPWFQENGVEGSVWLTVARFGDGLLVSARDITEQRHAELSLAETGRVNLLLAENASDFVLQAAPDGVITWASTSVTPVLGWLPEDLVGQQTLDLAHPDDLERTHESVPRLLFGQSVSGRARIRCPNGSYRWISRRWRPIADDTGSVVALVAGFRDVQAEVDVENALQASEDHYRLVAENASDFVVLTQSDRVISWVSPAVTRSMGWTPEELVGTTLGDLIHPDDLLATAVMRDAAYATPGADPAEAGIVIRLRTTCGTWRWMSEHIAPVVNELGLQAGVVASFQDVTELVLAQESAQRHRSRLRAAVDSLMDPQVLLEAVRDAAGQIVDFVYLEANPAACTHNRLTLSELLGARLLDLFPGHTGTATLEAYRRVVETGEPLSLDGVAYYHEIIGTELHYDIRAARVDDGICLAWRDVTERHLAEERRDDFLSHVSHELRAPLAVVHQFATLLADGVGGPPTPAQSELLSVMSRNIDQLKGMIDDLLEVVQAGGPGLNIDCHPLVLGEVLDEVTTGLVPAATQRGITLSQHHEELPPVLADPDRLREVLLNVLDNAIKFTPAGGLITVTATTQSREVVVQVTDTGCGMPPEELDHIFELFFHVDHQADKSRNGLGLGLYICKDLVERQGGTICAASTPGHGTTVTFTVPRCPAPDSATAGASESKGSP
ncbi:PAS domain-containing protein [Pengzhenrongella phosphoraccumulans]|uniref:PAS domain-containing protein n=1 Tax=Pengzhenrongella phosphoraccumulans TaxID=3114394 RepID=UPI0038910F41